MKKYFLWTLFFLFVGGFMFFQRNGAIKFTIGKEQKIISETGEDVSEITGELLISPYGVEKDLLDIFAGTRYKFRMWNYLLTEKTFLSMFKNLGLMGKEVQIILENDTYGGDSKAFDKAKRKLENIGVELVSDEKMGTNFVHAKTMLIDDETFVIATANFTYPSLRRNREYRFVGKDKEVFRSLSNIFDKDFRGKKLSKKDIDPHLYVCPIDCREKISNALNNAEKSIQIETQYIQDKDIVTLLKRQKFNNVNVQILVGNRQDEGRLEFFGTGVKMLGNPYIHAKNILIDGELLIMGSANLSNNALNNNREIGIFIDDSSVIKKFERQFKKDRKIAKDGVFEKD